MNIKFFLREKTRDFISQEGLQVDYSLVSEEQLQTQSLTINYYNALPLQDLQGSE
jgi:hypothetical protein